MKTLIRTSILSSLCFVSLATHAAYEKELSLLKPGSTIVPQHNIIIPAYKNTDNGATLNATNKNGICFFKVEESSSIDRSILAQTEFTVLSVSRSKVQAVYASYEYDLKLKTKGKTSLSLICRSGIADFVKGFDYWMYPKAMTIKSVQRLFSDYIILKSNGPVEEEQPYEIEIIE